MLLGQEQGVYVFTATLIIAHAYSRFMAVVAIQISGYVFEQAKTKSKPMAASRLNLTQFATAATFALLPFFFLPMVTLVVIVPMLLAMFLMVRYFNKWIGGYTGDCLGSIQQVTEVVCYLSLLVLWRFT